MADREDDLHATADDIASDAARLTAIEEAKESLDIDDPRLGELSAESERLARGLVPKTVAERELVAERAEADPDAPSTNAPSDG